MVLMTSQLISYRFQWTGCWPVQLEKVLHAVDRRGLEAQFEAILGPSRTSRLGIVTVTFSNREMLHLVEGELSPEYSVKVLVLSPVCIP